jgi:hypothetical protein
MPFGVMRKKQLSPCFSTYYNNIMNKEEFEYQIIAADRDLREQGLNVTQRAHEMFDVLSPNSSFLFQSDLNKHFLETAYAGQDLYDKIQSWYVDHYGERSQMYIRLRTMPIILLDDVYFFRIPLKYGTQPVPIDLIKLIDDFTSLTVHLLSEEEVARYIKAFHEGYSLSLKIDNMYTHLRGSKPSSRASRDPFIVRAERDRGIAIRSLTSPYDCNNSIFHSQQFAEKMIKSLLFTVEGIEEDEITHKYGHKMHKLWTRAKVDRDSCGDVDTSVGVVSQINMGVRYSLEDLSINNAVSIFWEALRIASFCAEEIQKEHRR